VTFRTETRLIAAVLAIAACRGNEVRVAPTGGRAGPSSAAPADYLVVVPHAFAVTVAPLIELRRRQGHGVVTRFVEDVVRSRPAAPSHEEALRDEISALAAEYPALHFVLLAGDPRGDDAVPTFHRKLGAWVGEGLGDDYATDHPFALFRDHPLAVGRLPARTTAELEGMVSKIIAYESDAPDAWARRVLVFAGPANFGPQLDPVIEDFATSTLDSEVPHEFDLGVVFAQPTSAYAFRFDRLGSEMASEMSGGALLAVFAGHGSPRSFDTVRYRHTRYPIGTASDLAAIDASHGNPIFVAITCSAGAFDAPERSISETAMLNPHGAIASFGAAAFSGAYVNVLVSDEILQSLLVARAPTVGDAILTAKTRLPGASSILKYAFGDGTGDMATSADAIAEHLFIYNLFGDPATRPAYPERAKIELYAAVEPPDSPFDVVVSLPAAGFARVEVTLETERTRLRQGILAPDALDRLDLPAAFEAMEKDHALANDKVVSRATAAVEGRTARLHLESPTTPGSYWVRALALGPSHAAAGAERIEVR
jgi:hypothetical protein